MQCCSALTALTTAEGCTDTLPCVAPQQVLTFSAAARATGDGHKSNERSYLGQQVRGPAAAARTRGPQEPGR